MAKSEVLDAIREDFRASGAVCDTCTVAAFCDFAADWLAKAGVLGVGHTASGLALRLADGRELGLITPDEAPAPPSIAVGISTGGGGSVRSGGSIEQPGISITGRR